MSATNKSIWRLVNGGDWACSWGEPTGLQEVCLELTTLLEPPMAARARDIARQAAADMAAASRQWRDLVALLGRPVSPEARSSA
ncbi:MAG TPA: hypothetical protein VML75_04045, partial [Kofleriaceae bacterium]|nr:hypothetical protein [Kofleriaceae bacterium]